MADNQTILDILPKPSENPLLFGHEAQRRFLQRQRQSGRLHHALLLEGEEGIGKAGFAFHFAFNLLAEGDKPDARADLAAAGAEEAETALSGGRRLDAASPLWRKMGQSAHPGLLYISRGRDLKTDKMRAAVGVEDIRRISRFLQQTAADKGWRIVIIDPADDMNRNAANALLKTLEEPPQKTLFMLISHNLGRLLPTIRSRCQALRLKPLPEESLRAALAALTAPLGRNFAAALCGESIALAEGSVRRALILLDEGGGAARALDSLLKAPVFHVPQAQKIAEELTKRDNGEAYGLFLNHVLDLLHKKARSAAQADNLPQSCRFADFYAEQAEAMQNAAAFNLDKKQFILVMLQQLHDFLGRG